MSKQKAWLLSAIAILSATPQPAFAGTPTVQDAPGPDLEANKALVRAFLTALEAGDIPAMIAIRGGGGATHGPNGESRVVAASASLAERCPMCAALPDRKITIEGMVAEGDLVSVRSTWTGTYSGGYRGMEIAAPKPVTVRYASTYRIANGRIVENWASYDRLALAVQLGFDLASGEDQTPQQVPPALEEAIAESHEALRMILNGDPSGYVALFADREDITLGNPFGPFGVGRAAVLAALNNAAKKYTDGSVRRVERVAVYGGGNRFVLVEIEHDRAKLGTSPDFADFAARVTSVYEKIGVQWKLVHRHADPITSARPAESMLSSQVPPSVIHSNANGEANKALVRAFLKALETGDIAAMNAIRGAAGVTHSPNGESRPATTSANLGERCPMCAALPDRKISIDMMLAEGDLVTVRSTWTGTYSGGYRGMAIAAPKPVTVRYVNIYRITDGRIVENWASYDRLALAEQLGFDLMSGKVQAQQ